MSLCAHVPISLSQLSCTLQSDTRAKPFIWAVAITAALGGLIFGYDIGGAGATFVMDGFKIHFDWECAPDDYGAMLHYLILQFVYCGLHLLMFYVYCNVQIACPSLNAKLMSRRVSSTDSLELVLHLVLCSRRSSLITKVLRNVFIWFIMHNSQTRWLTKHNSSFRCRS